MLSSRYRVGFWRCLLPVAAILASSTIWPSSLITAPCPTRALFSRVAGRTMLDSVPGLIFFFEVTTFSFCATSGGSSITGGITMSWLSNNSFVSSFDSVKAWSGSTTRKGESSMTEKSSSDPDLPSLPPYDERVSALWSILDSADPRRVDQLDKMNVHLGLFLWSSSHWPMQVSISLTFLV